LALSAKAKESNYFLSIFVAIFLSAILISGGITTSEGQQPFQDSIIVTTNVDPTPHILKLKAIQDADQQDIVSANGFKIDTTNVVSAPVNSQLVVFPTDPMMSVLEAKVKFASGEFRNLNPSIGQQRNTFSLTTLPMGIYTLDILTLKESQKGAYEGILIISNSNSVALNPAQIQNQITKVSHDVDIVFKTVGNDPCNYYGLNICDKNGDCDSERFDCWSECKDGSTAVTGQCPGDDDKDCWDNGEPNGKCDEDNGEDLPECDGSYQDCKTESGQVCEAGTTEDGCELDGYHCIEDEGCGNFSDGICEDCDTDGESEEEEEETANCGGEPCTATEKEDSTLDDETEYEDDGEIEGGEDSGDDEDEDSGGDEAAADEGSSNN
jgi:hypothetical protein